MSRTFAIAVAVLAAAAAGLVLAARQSVEHPRPRATTETTAYGLQHPAAATEAATFAAGCFWGLEHALRQVEGVTSTAAGFCGGTLADPTYRQVSAGRTGHAEAVQVRYDPARVSYDQLLDVFWASHNPMQFEPEGPDEAPLSGRSIVFVHTPQQEQAALASKRRLQASGKYQRPIPTEIAPAPTFYRAEDEHQQYAEKHGGGACRVR